MPERIPQHPATLKSTSRNWADIPHVFIHLAHLPHLTSHRGGLGRSFRPEDRKTSRAGGDSLSTNRYNRCAYPKDGTGWNTTWHFIGSNHPQWDASPNQLRRQSAASDSVGLFSAAARGALMLRIDPEHGQVAGLARWPERLSRETFHLVAYPLMLLSRRLEERILELFQKGYVKGTVTHQRRQRGDGDWRRDAVSSGPRRGVAAAPRLRRPSAPGGDAP